MSASVDFSKFCTPAKIYLVLSILASVLALFNRMPLIPVAFNLLFAFIWAWVLAWLCRKGLKAVSWFLVLLPFIMYFMTMLRGTMNFYKIKIDA